MIRITTILGFLLIATLVLSPSVLQAQQYPAVDGRQFPLNQMSPPGTAADWAAAAGRTCPEYFQPVRINLPTTGVVTYFEGTPDRAYALAAPAQASLLVGRVYRLRVSDMPEFPGVDLFPSIELIDRLHPPVGRAEDFPIEFELTLDELEWAAAGRLVTKVVYLEQPDRVPVVNMRDKIRIQTIAPSKNVIAAADVLGRPMAIVRLGGRTPNPNEAEPAFFGPGGPIIVTQKNPPALGTSVGRQKGAQTSWMTPSASFGVQSSSSADETTAGVVNLGRQTMPRMAQR